MKKFTLAAVVLFLLAFAASAQATKTETGKKLEAVNKQIADTRAKIAETEKDLTEALKYADENSPDVKRIKTQLDAMRADLRKLLLEQSVLARRARMEALPNNNIELTKILIEQNERIIEQNERIIDLLFQLSLRGVPMVP